MLCADTVLDQTKLARSSGYTAPRCSPEISCLNGAADGQVSVFSFQPTHSTVSSIVKDEGLGWLEYEPHLAPTRCAR